MNEIWLGSEEYKEHNEITFQLNLAFMKNVQIPTLVYEINV